jgi:hypothetical protein
VWCGVVWCTGHCRLVQSDPHRYQALGVHVHHHCESFLHHLPSRSAPLSQAFFFFFLLSLVVLLESVHTVHGTGFRLSWTGKQAPRIAAYAACLLQFGRSRFFFVITWNTCLLVARHPGIRPGAWGACNHGGPTSHRPLHDSRLHKF